ncbi:MAG: hypothetical protein OXC69_07075 [Candidatus Tectomicrobia bacterium]|nr:hypothetical protein [Candidatus Tectomicrobia bacterium]
MAKAQLFGQILEGIETLSIEDQEVLEEILHRRIVERRREELAHDVQLAQQEFQAGQSRPVTPDELMNEIME